MVAQRSSLSAAWAEMPSPLKLGPQDLRNGIQAHKVQRAVICEGVLLRMGRATILTTLTSFRMAPEPEEKHEEPLLLYASRFHFVRRARIA